MHLKREQAAISSPREPLPIYILIRQFLIPRNPLRVHPRRLMQIPYRAVIVKLERELERADAAGQRRRQELARHRPLRTGARAVAASDVGQPVRPRAGDAVLANQRPLGVGAGGIVALVEVGGPQLGLGRVVGGDEERAVAIGRVEGHAGRDGVGPIAGDEVTGGGVAWG